MKTIIVGCGKVGSCLTNDLARKGYQVTIVDRNPKAFKALKSEAQNDTTMGEPQAPEGRIRCVLTAGLIAKEIFHVPKVIVRIDEPKRERIFRELGLEIICPTMLGAKGILDLLFPCGEIPLETNDTILALTATKRVEELKRISYR